VKDIVDPKRPRIYGRYAARHRAHPQPSAMPSFRPPHQTPAISQGRGRSVAPPGGLAGAEPARPWRFTRVCEREGISLFRGDRPGGPIAQHQTKVPTCPPWPSTTVTRRRDAVCRSMAIALASASRREACARGQPRRPRGRPPVRRRHLSIRPPARRDLECAGAGQSRQGRRQGRHEDRGVRGRFRRGGRQGRLTNGRLDILKLSATPYLLQFAVPRQTSLSGAETPTTRSAGSRDQYRPFVDQSRGANDLAPYRSSNGRRRSTGYPARAASTEVRPDVLVKGGDYTPERLVGRELSRSSGAQGRHLAPG